MPAELTTEEVLAELRICRATFWKRIRQGIIQPIPGNPMLERQRRLYFRREDVERWKREGIHQQPTQRAS